MRGIPVVVALALSCVLSPAANAETCPPSAASFCGNPPVLLDAAEFDSTNGWCSVGYDLPRGTVRMSQVGTLGMTYMETVDQFDVTGVPAGTPVSLTVQLVVDGSISTQGCGGSGCYGFLDIRLASGALIDEISYSPTMWNPGSYPIHDVRSISLTIVAGTPVEIRARIGGKRAPGGSHASEGTGTLLFRVPAPGQAVVSCHGYASQVTPSRRTSWGALKTIYR